MSSAHIYICKYQGVSSTAHYSEWIALPVAAEHDIHHDRHGHGFKEILHDLHLMKPTDMKVPEKDWAAQDKAIRAEMGREGEEAARQHEAGRAYRD